MLSKREIEAIKKSAESLGPGEGTASELRRAARRLIAHIECVGEFAPEGPSPEALDEAIAKARGWSRGYLEDRSIEADAVWLVGDEPRMSVESFRPSRNLGQALESAAALEAYVSVQSADGLLWTTATDVISQSATAATASYAISCHLYDIIRARRSELPFETHMHQDSALDGSADSEAG